MFKGFKIPDTDYYFNTPVIFSETCEVVENSMYLTENIIYNKDLIKFVNNIYEQHPELISKMYIDGSCWLKRYCMYFNHFGFIDPSIPEEYQINSTDQMLTFDKNKSGIKTLYLDINKFMSYDNIDLKLSFFKKIGKNDKFFKSFSKSLDILEFFTSIKNSKFFELVDHMLYDEDFSNYLSFFEQFVGKRYLENIFYENKFQSVKFFKEKINEIKNFFSNLREIQEEIFYTFFNQFDGVETHIYYEVLDNLNDFDKYFSNFISMFQKAEIYSCPEFETFVTSLLILNDSNFSFENKVKTILNLKKSDTAIAKNILSNFILPNCNKEESNNDILSFLVKNIRN